MEMKDMPRWMNVIPVLTGVAIASLGILILPKFGIRATFGPIVGLPVGALLGFGIVWLMIKDK